MQARSLTLVAALALTACATGTRHSPPLYEALGGEAGIAALVDAIVEEAHADARFGDVFANADLHRLREQLAVQLCELADGPCRYEGLSMLEAHSGMRISAAEFNWFVEDTQQAMRRLGLSWSTQNRLLARLVPMQADIVQDDEPAPAPEAEPVDPLGLGGGD